MSRDQSTIAQHAADLEQVRRIEGIGAAELALPLGAHLGEDVALVRMLSLVTLAGFLEALGRSAVDFDLWHITQLRISMVLQRLEVGLTSSSSEPAPW